MIVPHGLPGRPGRFEFELRVELQCSNFDALQCNNQLLTVTREGTMADTHLNTTVFASRVKKLYDGWRVGGDTCFSNIFLMFLRTHKATRITSP